MTTSTPVSETQTFTITEEISVAASLDQTFDSLIAQMGRYNETPDGDLRLLDQSVPSVYGPTADENPFAM